jgi:hypothetical protein
MEIRRNFGRQTARTEKGRVEIGRTQDKLDLTKSWHVLGRRDRQAVLAGNP